MAVVVATTLVSLLLGFGAIQELVVLGIRAGQVQPFWIGVTGAAVCALLIASALVLHRGWKNGRELALGATVLFVAFHIYASLPPHRNVGALAAMIATIYGFGFLLFALRRPPQEVEQLITD